MSMGPLPRCSTSGSSVDNVSKLIQDDLLKRRAMMSLFPQREVITQEDQDERTRYHIPMPDRGN
jgi:hypothetical protein